MILLAVALSASALDPSLGAVLAPPEARRLLHQCSRAAPQGVTGDWAPSTADIRELEARLPKALDEALGKHRAGGARAPVVARQYAGFVIGRRRIVYVNGFTKEETEPPFPGAPAFDWRRKAMSVCDGGPVFFGVEYDPATGTFANFAFNGAI